MIQHKLTVYDATGESEITLTQSKYVLGRASGCDIPLNCIFVAKKHAFLTRLEDFDGTTTYLMMDGDPGIESSRNGSFVNGIHVSSHVLQNGDVLTFGQVSVVYSKTEEYVVPQTSEA